jgi:hypothetical protein
MGAATTSALVLWTHCHTPGVTLAWVAAPFWQVGIVVGDIDAAQRELSLALGVEWGEVVEAQQDGSSYRISISKQGPPYLELLQGSPGSPWDASSGSRLDHISYFVDDIGEHVDRLEAAGIATEFRGELAPMAYNRAPASGVRLEPLERSFKPKLERWFGLEGLE